MVENCRCKQNINKDNENKNIWGKDKSITHMIIYRKKLFIVSNKVLWALLVKIVSK